MVKTLPPADGGWLEDWVSASRNLVSVKSTGFGATSHLFKAGSAGKKSLGQGIGGGAVVCGLCRLTVKGVAVICPKCGECMKQHTRLGEGLGPF